MTEQSGLCRLPAPSTTVISSPIQPTRPPSAALRPPHSPVVRGEAHADDVPMDINDVIQRVKELNRAPLVPQHRPGGRHLMRQDPFNPLGTESRVRRFCRLLGFKNGLPWCC